MFYERLYFKDLRMGVHAGGLDDIKEFIFDDIEVKVNFHNLTFNCDYLEIGISEHDVKKIFKSLEGNVDLIKFINENSKSRDGFLSFYEGFEAVKSDDEIYLRYILKYYIYKFKDYIN